MATKKKVAVRVFETGATRDVDDGKLDFDGFLSPYALEEFAKYMHKNRYQKDGTVRSSDNWKKGIPQDVFRKSAWRHFFSWWKKHQSGEDTTEEACALMFNVMGSMHEFAKSKEKK